MVSVLATRRVKHPEMIQMYERSPQHSEGKLREHVRQQVAQALYFEWKSTLDPDSTRAVCDGTVIMRA